MLKPEFYNRLGDDEASLQLYWFLKKDITLLYCKNPTNDIAAIIPFRMKYNEHDLSCLDQVKLIRDKQVLFPNI